MSGPLAGLPPRAAARLRSASTLAVLTLVLLLGVAWAWSAVTEPFPGRVQAPVCVATQVAEGDKVFPDQVTVSVLNAGTRAGLAQRTMGNLVDSGLARGSLGNAPPGTEVRNAQIWTDDPEDPAVLLVRSYLGKRAVVVEQEPTLPGVNIVVGDKFRVVKQGRKSVVARADTEICSPPTDEL